MRTGVILLTALLHGTMAGQGPPAYCIPVATDSTVAGDFIDGVQLADLSNIGSGGTGGAGYSDLRFAQVGLSTRLTPGASYFLELVSGDRAGTAYAAWIDLDQDLDFAPAERIGDLVSTGAGSSGVLPFTVPADSRRGYTTLRVRCTYQTTPVDPCLPYTYGETEDYTVLIDDDGPCIPLIPLGNQGGEAITGVVLNTFSRVQTVPDAQPYADNRDLGAMLSIGIPYNLSITSGQAAGQLVAAWIDWNGDGDLDDANELVGQGYAGAPFQTLVLSFTVPADAFMGQRLMRLRAWDSGLPPSPCGDRLYGETEDYTVGLRNPGFLCYPVAGVTDNGDEVSSFVLAGTTFTAPDVWPHHFVHDDQPIRFTRGSTDTLELVTGTHFPTRFQLWLDVNYDGDFNDPGEALASLSSTGPGQSLSLPFTLPATMSVGQTHLRLRASDGNAPAPQSCGPSTTGEVEDVVIVVEDPAGPCIPYTAQWTQYGDFIDGVQLGSITSAGSGGTRGRAYRDLRTEVTDLDAGGTYDLLLTAGSDTAHTFDAFLDLNGDGDVEDADEHMGRVTASGAFAQVTLTFTVPTTAVPDSVLFRVRASDADTIITGCADLAPGRGETEDRTAVISNTTGLNTRSAEDLQVIPMPEAGIVVALTPASWAGAELSVLDAMGRTVHRERLRHPRQEIPASSWSPGTYVLHVLDRTRSTAKQFPWP